MTDVKKTLAAYLKAHGEYPYIPNGYRRPCLNCWEQVIPAWDPELNQFIAVDSTACEPHKCVPMPNFKCMNCKDKGYTLINYDRTGQDSDIHRLRCKCGAKYD